MGSVKLINHSTVTRTERDPRTGKVTATRKDTFRFEVTGVPCVKEQSYSAHSNVYFDPDTLIVTIGGDWGEGATARGPNIKKDGTHGQRRPSRLWLLKDSENAEKMPPWVWNAVCLAILTAAETPAYVESEQDGS